MAPESCGDRVVVVSSPYKSHTQSSASIQLGQHHLKSFAENLALRSCHKVGLGLKLHAASLELCVAALLLRLTLRWTGNKISKHLNRPYARVVRLQGLCFREQHAQTVGDLLPSSVVAAPTSTAG